MANVTGPDVATVKGGDPQHLMPKILRLRCYADMYWKQHCFGLTAETLVDRAAQLEYIGGTYSHNAKPTAFLCLVLKLLQIQPDKEIVVEFIRNEEFKYVRALGALYLRLVGRGVDVYQYLEPLYNDYRKLAVRSVAGWSITHMDEFIDALLTSETVCDLTLPLLPKRAVLEATVSLPPRVSALEDDLMADDADEDGEMDSSATRNKSEAQAIHTLQPLLSRNDAHNASATKSGNAREAVMRNAAMNVEDVSVAEGHKAAGVRVTAVTNMPTSDVAPRANAGTGEGMKDSSSYRWHHASDGLNRNRDTGSPRHETRGKAAEEWGDPDGRSRRADSRSRHIERDRNRHSRDSRSRSVLLQRDNERYKNGRSCSRSRSRSIRRRRSDVRHEIERSRSRSIRRHRDTSRDKYDYDDDYDRGRGRIRSRSRSSRRRRDTVYEERDRSRSRSIHRRDQRYTDNIHDRRRRYSRSPRRDGSRRQSRSTSRGRRDHGDNKSLDSDNARRRSKRSTSPERRRRGEQRDRQVEYDRRRASRSRSRNRSHSARRKSPVQRREAISRTTAADRTRVGDIPRPDTTVGASAANVTAEEGSVAWWNERRAALGLKPLK